MANLNLNEIVSCIDKLTAPINLCLKGLNDILRFKRITGTAGWLLFFFVDSVSVGLHGQKSYSKRTPTIHVFKRRRGWLFPFVDNLHLNLGTVVIITGKGSSRNTEIESGLAVTIA
jgi:hypothetical protein